MVPSNHCSVQPPNLVHAILSSGSFLLLSSPPTSLPLPTLPPLQYSAQTSAVPKCLPQQRHFSALSSPLIPSYHVLYATHMSHIYSTRHHNVGFYMYILTAQLHCGCSVSQTLAPPPEVLHLKSLRTETLLGSKTHLNKCPQSTKCPFWFLGKSIQSPIQCDTKKDRRRTLLFCQCLN